MTDEPSEPIDVEALRAAFAAEGLRIVAGPGPLRDVLPEAIETLSGVRLVASPCNRTDLPEDPDAHCAACGRTAGDHPAWRRP